LFPDPLEKTFIVEALMLLKENTPGPGAPVPPNSIPVTVDVDPVGTHALLTETTDVRSLDVCDDVPPKYIPFNVTGLAVEPVYPKFIDKYSTREFSPIVIMVVGEDVAVKFRIHVCNDTPVRDVPSLRKSGPVNVY